jgi:hypothetical protein
MSPESIDDDARREGRAKKSGARRGGNTRPQNHCKGRDPNNNNNAIVVAAGGVRGEHAADNAARSTSQSRGGGGKDGRPCLVLGRVWK